MGPQQVTAAEIQARVQDAVTSLSAIRGTMVVVTYEEGEAAEMRWVFAATANGDFRWTGVSRKEDLAYNASSGVGRSLSWEDDGSVYAGENTGLAAGPPDPDPLDWVLDRQLGSVVRALLAAQDARVQAAEYEGREVWTFETDVQPNRVAGISGGRLQITVDQATGFPIRAVETSAGSAVREVCLEDLELDPELPAGTFDFAFPPEAQVGGIDNGFRRVQLGEIESISGYRPLLPIALPDGFVLTEVTAAQESQATGKEGMNPQSRGVVSVAYRRGFDRVVVSTRLVGEDPSLWSNPLASGEGFADNPEPITLLAGAFAGGKAELLIDPLVTPHLWALNQDLVVTIAGDLSREELIRAAESLEPWSGQ